VSNVHALCIKFHFLAWLCKLPAPVVGIISVISIPFQPKPLHLTRITAGYPPACPARRADDASAYRSQTACTIRGYTKEDRVGIKLDDTIFLVSDCRE
jgi:hypothetical protein